MEGLEKGEFIYKETVALTCTSTHHNSPIHVKVCEVELLFRYKEKHKNQKLQVWTIVGGELVSSSKISLCSVRDDSGVEEGDGEEEEEEKKVKRSKKDEDAGVEDNSCEEGKIGYEKEQESEKVREMDEDDRKKLKGNSWEKVRAEKRNSEASKRSRLGGRWSKMGSEFEEDGSSDRRSRSESDLLSDLSRSASLQASK